MSARRIPPNRRSITGQFPSRKNGRFVPFESGLERDNFFQLEFDDRVVTYEAQPVRIEFSRGGGRWYPGFPDLAVTYRAELGPGEIHDVKFRSEIFGNWVHLKPRLLAACAYARQQGKLYRLRSEVEIRTAFLPQAKFLYRYLLNFIADQSYANLFRDALRASGKSTPAELLRTCIPDTDRAIALPTLWSMVATREISADLCAPLTMSSDLWMVDGSA